jgi:hypothetical protein
MADTTNDRDYNSDETGSDRRRNFDDESMDTEV